MELESPLSCAHISPLMAAPRQLNPVSAFPTYEYNA